MSARWAEVFQANRIPSGSCATPSEIWEVVAARLPHDRTQELLDHTLACGECAHLWRLAHEAQVEAAREDAAFLRPVQELGRPVPRVRWLGWAAVGAAGLAAALTFALKPRPPEREVVRGQAVGGIAPLVTDVALPRSAVVLRWTDQGPEARYALTITTADLTPVDSALDLGRPEYMVPEAALQHLPSGTTLVWRVEARLPGGRVASSPPARVQLR